jgi:hypothetical protein
MKHAFKAAALLAGGVAALDAARRFSRRVPRDNTVVVFETIGRVPGKKGQKILIGYPVHATASLPAPDEASTRQLNKEIRKGAREADKWLRGSSKEDGKRRANRTLGGNRDAVCEFVLVKRSRNAKGKAIGVTKRCFTRPELVVEQETTETVVPSIPGLPPEFPPGVPVGNPFYKD